MTDSINVSPVAIVFANRESGVRRIRLSEAGAKTGALVVECDDGTKLSKAVVFV